MNANTVVVFALIGLRALAEYDPVEYRRATDLSKGELEEKIRQLLKDPASRESTNSEAAARFGELRTIDESAEGHTERSFLLRQLHMACLQRAQQLSLPYSRRAGIQDRTEIRSPHFAESPTRLRTTEDEFIRLAVMRLLRELPGYSPTFEYPAKDARVDCVLDPANADDPVIVIEAKQRIRAEDGKRLASNLRRYVSFWGKGTVPVVVAREIDERAHGVLAGSKVIVLAFDPESNSFLRDGVSPLLSRVR